MRHSLGSRRLWPVAAALAGAAACELPSFGAPAPRSEQGEAVFTVWQRFFLAGIGVGVLVWGLLIFVLVRYRRRDDQVPDQRGYQVPLEITYTAIPVVIVAVLFAASWASADRVSGVDADAPTRVQVLAFQWSWQFDYPDEDVTVTGEPGEPPELVLPVGERAHLELVSADVAHSFWTPDFLSKRDLIPGVDNEIQVTPTETGEYIGRCAEFCGLDHWRMYYSVRVVPPAEYEAWLDEQRAAEAGDPADRPAESDAEERVDELEAEGNP